MAKVSEFITSQPGRIGLTQATDEVVVSTVRLPFYLGDAPYETLVWSGKFDGKIERYETVAKAKLGHERWVKKVQEAENES